MAAVPGEGVAEAAVAVVVCAGTALAAPAVSSQSRSLVEAGAAGAAAPDEGALFGEVGEMDLCGDGIVGVALDGALRAEDGQLAPQLRIVV